MATDKPRFTITVSDDTLNEIVHFQHDRNLATRSNAIQQLIKIGIEDLKKQLSDSPNSVSAEAMEVARAFDAATDREKEMVRLTLDPYMGSPLGRSDKVV